MRQGVGAHNPYAAKRLLADYELYDRSVDIVSAYEWLFTETKNLPATVAHFERYPKIAHPDGQSATPDFTVLFTDGTAVVGEIANLPLAEQGVDSLCAQILRYDQLASVPGPVGEQRVSLVDVLLLVPIETGTDAVKRVIMNRLDADDHPYKPLRRPTLIQFAHMTDKYVFQRRPDEVNGELHKGSRSPNYADFTDLSVWAENFAELKIRRCFMNDPISDLYMATTLWMKVWPSIVGAGSREFNVTTRATVRTLQEHYGMGRADDVRRAMGLLVAADLADRAASDSWRVRRRALRGADQDVHRIIAERVMTGPERRSPVGASRPLTRRGRRTSPGPDQGTLFDP